MPTAYDTFNYDQALQRPADILAAIGNQRLAIEAQQGNRLGAVEMMRMNQSAQEASDQRRYENQLKIEQERAKLQEAAAKGDREAAIKLEGMRYTREAGIQAMRNAGDVARVEAQERSRLALAEGASRRERETAYMVAFPKTSKDELGRLSDADLIRGIQKHSDENLRDSALGIDQSIQNEATQVEALLATQSAADQRAIKDRVASNPAFLKFVEDNVRPGFFGIGAKGGQFAADFASGKATLDQLIAEASDPKGLLDAYAVAVESASQGMLDKNGQPVIPAGTLTKLQRHLQQVESLTALKQKYVSQIGDPKLQIEALGAMPPTALEPGRGPNGQPVGPSTFRDDAIGGVLPGTQPTAPAGATAPPVAGQVPPPMGPAMARPNGVLGAPSQAGQVPPPVGMDAGLGRALDTRDQRTNVRYSALGTPIASTSLYDTAMDVRDIYNRAPEGVRHPYDAILGFRDQTQAASDRLATRIGTTLGTIPPPNPGSPASPIAQQFYRQQGAADPRGFATPQAPAPAVPQMSAGGAQDPFVAQRQAAALQQVLGSGDMGVLQQAKQLAMSEGVDEQTINNLGMAAAKGDMQARNRIMQYVQRAQSGSMMAPPVGQPVY